MGDRSPAETIRQAITVLRCEHSHPISDPPAWEAGPCTECGTPYEVTTRLADMMPQPPLYGPLADLLAAVVEVWPDDQPVHDNGSAASRRRVAALAIARVLLGEAT